MKKCQSLGLTLYYFFGSTFKDVSIYLDEFMFEVCCINICINLISALKMIDPVQ